MTGELANMKKYGTTTIIVLPVKVSMLKSLITSIYSCETWTNNSRVDNRIVLFEMRCYRRLMKIPWRHRLTNKAVTQKIIVLIRDYEAALRGRIIRFTHTSCGLVGGAKGRGQ